MCTRSLKLSQSIVDVGQGKVKVQNKNRPKIPAGFWEGASFREAASSATACTCHDSMHEGARQYQHVSTNVASCVSQAGLSIAFSAAITCECQDSIHLHLNKACNGAESEQSRLRTQPAAPQNLSDEEAPLP